MANDHDRTVHISPDASSPGESTAHDVAPTKPAETLPLGTRIGPYLIVDVIGSGAMGVVYSAFDPRLDRTVAIKMMRAVADEGGTGAPRLLREAQALAQLSHPNVVPVFDVGQHHSAVFLAMELVRGEDLRRWLSRGRRHWREVVGVMLDAGRGLAAAHAAGIVHRDFKPDNVLLDAEGRARITDFGLARAHGESDPSQTSVLDGLDSLSGTLTRTGSVVGTPSYMAPEQHTGKPVDARADQYAFCVTLYEAVYGERPFVGHDLQTLAHRKWSESYASEVAQSMRREVPPGLHAAIIRGLRRRPGDRFTDMPALLAAIDGVGARPPSPWRWLGVGAAGLGAAVGAAVGLGRTEHCPEARDQLAGVWDEPRAQQIAAAFADAPTKVAGDTWPRVRARLDAHADRWVAAHAEICGAARTADRGALELDAGMLCLRQRRAQTGAVLDVLAEGTRDSVHGADALLAALTDPHDCSDATAVVEPPHITRERQLLREQLDVAEVRIDAAQYGVAREQAVAIVDGARRIGAVDLELEATLVIATADVRSGRYPAGEDGYTTVFWGAQAEGLDALALRAATRLVFMLGSLVDRTDEGFTWLRHAQTQLGRVGPGDSVDRAILLSSSASLYDSALQEERGEQLLRDAIAMRLRLQPEGGAALATLRNNLATRLSDRGAFEEAIALHRLALHDRIARLGPHHPDVAMSLINEARPLIELDRGQDALERLDEAEPIVRASLGDGHPMLDSIQIARGGALMELGQFDAARAYLQLALSTMSLRMGAKARPIGHMWNAIATTYLQQRDAPRARIFFGRAREVFTAPGAANEEGRAYVDANLAVLELVQGNLDEARAHIDAALESFRRVRAAGHADFALAFIERAQIQLAQGEHDAAARSLDEASGIHVPGHAGRLRADVIASVRLRHRWQGSRLPPEVERELRAVRARIAAQDARSPEVFFVDRWLAELDAAAEPERAVADAPITPTG